MNITRTDLSRAKDDLSKQGREIKEALRQVEVNKEIQEIFSADVDYDTGQLKMRNGTFLSIEDANKLIGGGDLSNIQVVPDPALLHRDSVSV